MTPIDAVIKRLLRMPYEQQEEVLRFVESLPELEETAESAAPEEQPPSLCGIWAGLDITEEDIAEARREMWGKYMSDDETP